MNCEQQQELIRREGFWEIFYHLGRPPQWTSINHRSTLLFTSDSGVELRLNTFSRGSNVSMHEPGWFIKKDRE